MHGARMDFPSPEAKLKKRIQRSRKGHMRSAKTNSKICRRYVVHEISTIHKFLDPQDGAAALAYGLVVDHRPSRLTFSKPLYEIFFTMSQYDSPPLSYGISETQASGTLLFRIWADSL